MAVVRHNVLRLAGSSQFSSLVTWLESCDDHRGGLLRVLTYHRIDDLHAQPHLYPEMISATPTQFAHQLEHLASHYRVISIDQVIEALHESRRLPPRSVLLTFDDAYRDFSQYAWPLLSKYGLPATLFVPTAYPDQPERAFWWDRLYGAFRQATQGETRRQFGSFRCLLNHVKSLPDNRAQELVDQLCKQDTSRSQQNAVLGWDELRRLAREGLSLGPHTRTHPLLNRISEEDAVRQAADSLADLQREVGEVPRVLAYPSGAYSEQVADRLGCEGFQLAFTTCRGINDLEHADRMRLRRINVARRTPSAVLRAQMLSGARYFNRCWPVRSALPEQAGH